MRRGKICSIVAILLVFALTASGCELWHTAGPEATCTEAQVCEKCGEVMTEPLGHTPGEEATCTQSQTCTVCNTVLVEAVGHTPGAPATCTEDQTCQSCGFVLEVASHTPGPEATCTKPQMCSTCDEVLVAATGHTPGPKATATTDQVCTVCNAVLVKATGTTVTYPFVYETVSGEHYHNNITAKWHNSVLICGDYALEHFNMQSSGNTTYASAVNAFVEKYPSLNVSVALIPKSCAFNSPYGYPQKYDNQLNYITKTYELMASSVKKIDAMSILKEHSGEYIYYRTDHHWTSLGAYYASVAYCNANGITPRKLESYETVINTGFIGTLYTYAGSSAGALRENLKTNPDYTVGHMPSTPYTMKYTGADGVVYKGTAINKKSKTYAGMFMCGDQPFTHIVTENKNGKKLLMFKQSYGNAFAPYMIDYYEEIVVIDVRSNKKSVEKVIAEYGITDVLIMNNVQASSSHAGSLKNQLAS